MRICLDPGHSGPFEPGACAGGVSEADINWYVARFAQRELKYYGHLSTITRGKRIENDELAFRAECSNDYNADLFLSIHCNSSERVEAEGTETFYYPGSRLGEIWARCLQFCMTDAMLTEDRGVKTADFQVLRETLAPAALLECGFISNRLDREMMTDSLEQWRMGAAIATAVEDYAKKIENLLPEAFTHG